MPRPEPVRLYWCNPGAQVWGLTGHRNSRQWWDAALVTKLSLSLMQAHGVPCTLGIRRQARASSGKSAMQLTNCPRAVSFSSAGTPGYLDPEYHLTSKVTDKGDVYSFGVLLLQMCTGQRAILAQHPKFSQAGSSLQAGSIPPGGPSLGPSKSAPEGVGAEAAEGGVAGGSGSRFTQKSTPSSVGPGQEQSPSTASGSVSMSPANRAAGMGSSTAFAGLGDGGMGPGEVRDGEPMPGEPIHISTWLEPYVRAKVVEPVADARFGNNYNKTALFRMLEIGLLCVQASARKRPGMSTVSRWLHEVREELAREVEEPEGQYSSVFAFDHHSTSRGSWGAGALDSLVETESWRSLTRGPSARSTWGAAGPRYSHPSPGAGPDTSMAYDQSTMQHAARMSQGR